MKSKARATRLGVLLHAHLVGAVGLDFRRRAWNLLEDLLIAIVRGNNAHVAAVEAMKTCVFSKDENWQIDRDDASTQVSKYRKRVVAIEGIRVGRIRGREWSNVDEKMRKQRRSAKLV